MERFILAALFVTLTATAIAQEKSITGKWAVHASAGGNESDFDCTIKQDGKALTGNCVNHGELAGSVDGDRLIWHTKGGQADLDFTGKLNADGKISGTIDVPAYGIQGSFEASPAK